MSLPLPHEFTKKVNFFYKLEQLSITYSDYSSSICLFIEKVTFQIIFGSNCENTPDKIARNKNKDGFVV